jgi:hypothetical protein
MPGKQVQDRHSFTFFDAACTVHTHVFAPGLWRFSPQRKRLRSDM